MQPLVSICSLVYNHEPYLRQCLDGFVMQQTSFPFEVVIHDDASTDGSAAIIREYATRYPNIFVPIYQTENQYSQGKKVSSTFVFPRARGKYIALCEGDDYWTDPLKLQKQVDFLEANPEYGLVHTGRTRYIHETGTFVSINSHVYDGNVFERLLCDNFIATLTACFRKDLLDKIDYGYMQQSFTMGDYPLWLEIAKISKLKYLPENTAVYRVLANSASHSADKRKQYEFHKNACEIKLFFSRIYPVSKTTKSKIRRQYDYWNSVVLAIDGHWCAALKSYVASKNFGYKAFVRFFKHLLIRH